MRSPVAWGSRGEPAYPVIAGRRLPAPSFEAVCAELDRRTRVALGFERIRALLGTLANPQQELRTVQVVGTTGGGYNAAGVEAAVEAARNAYSDRPLGVVFGALRDKDIGSMLAVLQKDADVLVLTRPKGERAAEPAQGWVN